MTWQERLATLRDLGRWDHALLMGLTLLDAAQVLAHHRQYRPQEPQCMHISEGSASLELLLGGLGLCQKSTYA